MKPRGGGFRGQRHNETTPARWGRFEQPVAYPAMASPPPSTLPNESPKHSGPTHSKWTRKRGLRQLCVAKLPELICNQQAGRIIGQLRLDTGETVSALAMMTSSIVIPATILILGLPSGGDVDWSVGRSG